MQKIRRQVLSIIAIVIGMFALAYASFPLYRLFCQITGYGGTVKQVDGMDVVPGHKIIKVRFNADIDSSLDWEFRPKQEEIELKTGKQALIYYIASNQTKEELTGMAVYNVTPTKAAKYFNKIECFCFNNQTLTAGQRVEMPVTFYIDPKIEQDPEMNDVSTVTLSYTLYRSENNPNNKNK